jgi:phosphate transport system substrate-binding protein
MKKALALAVLTAVVLTAAATAGVRALSGTVTADGSSTVGPYAIAAAEGFQKRNPQARVTVGISGTGGGFERFCRNETDLSNASRPMRNSEAIKCRDAGVKWVAFTVANDGLSVVVNRQNTWANCLTVAELKKIWEPGSKVDNWSQVRDGFPNVPLKLFGAGTDSGTFDYFTEAIVGEEGSSRSDYTPSEDDNVTVRGVSGQKGALGYFGLSYLVENAERVNGVAVDGGEGCVEPSVQTVQDGSYKPLSRPLFTYVNEDALAEKPALDPFLTFVLDNASKLARGAKFVPMTSVQVDQAHTALESGGVGVE